MKNIIILGSGRSGTSLVTGLLAGNGFFMGPELLDANDANPRGYFESEEINDTNEMILRRNRHWIASTLVRRYFFKSIPIGSLGWLQRVSLSAQLQADETVKERIQQHISCQPFCYKDPRFSYTLPLWQPYLPETRFIVVFRHPSSTVKSILNFTKDLTNFNISANQALNVWILMYRHILRFFNSQHNADNWLFVHYEQVLNKSALNAIRQFAEIGHLQENFIHPNLYHSEPDERYATTEALDLYSQLCQFSKKTVGSM